MTVPFDPKPSAELMAKVLTPELYQAATTIISASVNAEDWIGFRLQSKPHRKVTAMVTTLRNAANSFEALLADNSVRPMVDGDLWYQEPAVMHPGDIGQEEGR